MTITKLRQQNPLVHCMTNVVVTNFTANGLLAIGASPVMAYAKEEVETIASISGALLLNIGTLTKEEIEAMKLAGKAANKAGVPIVLDPVGAGATEFRTNTGRELLEELSITVLRANAGEIASLVGEEASVKGVDGALEGDHTALAKKAAKSFQTIVALTGETDIVTDGETVIKIKNGHFWMTKIVGTGCLLGAVIGAFLAVNENKLESVVQALTFYGIAGEFAYEKASTHGLGSFQTAFLNELSLITEETVKGNEKVEC